MYEFWSIFQNRTLWLCVAAWFAAQLIKLLLTLMRDKRLDIGRLVFGLGGMPSSHSAVVCCLATTLGIHMGFDSIFFTLSCVLALIVMVDAAGVRQETGKQATLLNKIVTELMETGHLTDQTALKELVGHTPLQVIAGAVLGVVLAILAQ